MTVLCILLCVCCSGLRLVIFGRVIRIFFWTKVGHEHQSITRYIRSKVSVILCCSIALHMYIVVYLFTWLAVCACVYGLGWCCSVPNEARIQLFWKTMQRCARLTSSVLSAIHHECKAYCNIIVQIYSIVVLVNAG